MGGQLKNLFKNCFITGDDEFIFVTDLIYLFLFLGPDMCGVTSGRGVALGRLKLYGTLLEKMGNN